MNWILKNKNKNAKALLIVLFFVFIFSFSSKVSAATCTKLADCQDTKSSWYDSTTPYCDLSTKTCTAYTGDAESRCIQSGGTYGSIVGCSCASPLKSNASAGVCQTVAVNTASVTEGGMNGSAAAAHPSVSSGADVYKEGTCGATDIECIFKKLLVGILNVVGWLMAIAATLFAWAIEPNNVSGTNGMLNKQAVKDVWIMVRDLLNMTFILILLFAAFCTIFQIDKWNLKKVWLNVLINALLVNFSFPIARFFIDVSNVAFYYFVNNLFSATGTTVVTGSSIFASFGASTNIGTLLAPQNYAQYNIAYLIGMIVVTFIIGMTLLVVAALFLVRLIALTMLVMFSPIGFVGYIFPSTSSYADKWWTNLFKYSFFAPIMIFMMAVALRITTVMGQENFNSFKSSAINNATANDASWIANAAFLAIPIIILWAGIGVAQSMGIAGANTVVSSVKKGGKWLANRPGALGGYAWKKTGIPGGVKKGYEKATKTGELFGSKKLGWVLKNGQPDREEKWAGAFVGGREGLDKAKTNMKETANKEDIEKGSKGHIDSGATADSLAVMMNDSSLTAIKRAQAAAAYQKFDFDDRKAHTMSTLTAAAPGSYGDHNEALTGAIHLSMGPNGLAQQAAAKAIADDIKAGRHVNAEKHRQLASYINKHAKTKVVDGVKS